MEHQLVFFSRINVSPLPSPPLPLTTRATPTTSSSLIDQTLRSDCDHSVLTSQSWPAEVAMVDQMGRETMSGQFSTLITWNKYRPGFSPGLPPTSRRIPPLQANIFIPLVLTGGAAGGRRLMKYFGRAGLSRSTSFATESLLGGDEIDAGKTEGSRVMKGTSEFTMGR